MHVGIVGAGITGLALGHYLDSEGIEFEIFERRSEPGGVIRSKRLDGRLLELGPQRTRLSPPVETLVDDLGLTEELIEANDVPLFVYRDGRLRRVPQTLTDAVRTDLLSFSGKLRALLEPWTAPPQPGESVHGYFARAFGQEFADYLADPLYGGLYGSDTRDMPVEYSLTQALDRFGLSGSLLFAGIRSRVRRRPTPPIVSFERGLQTLPDRLAAEYGNRVAFDVEITEIGDRGDRYALLADGGQVGLFDEVVLTVPAGTASELLANIDPGSAEALGALTYNPLAVVHLEAAGDLTGAGYQIPATESFATRGVTWNDSLLGRDGIYTAYLGGSHHPGLVERSEEELETLAAREFEDVTRVEALPLDTHRVVPGMPAYDESWENLEVAETPFGIHLCANYTDRAGIPGRLTAAKRLAEGLAARTE